jgi:effector-binding domain-containing protein
MLREQTMPYDVEVVRVEPIPTLAVRASLSGDEVPRAITKLFDKIYTLMDSLQIPRRGHNIMLYAGDNLNLEAAVEILVPVEGLADVINSQTPAGLAARTTHFGAYSGLGSAHKAVKDWCAANGHKLAGPRWEIYGHMSDDPSDVTTDVYYLLNESI